MVQKESILIPIDNFYLNNVYAWKDFMIQIKKAFVSHAMMVANYVAGNIKYSN